MISIGADHRGYKLKEEIMKYFDEQGVAYKDYGTMSEERMDFPIIATSVSKSIQNKEAELGILVCGTGFGMSMVANKYKGIRCAPCDCDNMARYAKAHSDVNILALPADFINSIQAISIIRTWLGTEFLGGRYQARINMIEEIEKENMK